MAGTPLQDGWYDGNGRRCLVDALRHLRARNAIVGDGTGFYLREAQPQWISKPITRLSVRVPIVRGHPGAHRPGARTCAG